MRKLIKGAAVLAFAVSASACSDLTEVNVNPNSPEVVPARFLLLPAIRNVVSNSVGSMLGTTSIWVQYTGEIQYASSDIYTQGQGTGTSFTSYYTGSSSDGALKNLDAIIRMNEGPNSVAVARILMAYQYHNMTDKWGAIPYSEALKADAEPSITLPRYDSQKDIYYNLFEELTDAEAMIDLNGPSITDQDLIYGGDMAKWKRFANSLRMRIAMRLSEVDPAKAQTEFRAAYDAGGFLSNSDDAVLWYSSDPNSRHPAYTNHLTRDDHAIGAAIVNLMTNGDATGLDYDQHDPRLAVFAERASSDGAYRGMPAGHAPGHAIPIATISRLADRWRKRPDGDAKVLTYSEVLFLQAEAALRGWIPGGVAEAENFYRAGIEASMEYYEIPTNQIQAYLAAHDEWDLNAPGSTPARQIAIQKWISLFGIGDEGWAEWRRTGWPELFAGPDNRNNDMIPRRYPYADVQMNQNPENLRAALEMQGMTNGHVDINTRLWWDVKPLP
jgi:hypothetical protein